MFSFEPNFFNSTEVELQDKMIKLGINLSDDRRNQLTELALYTHTQIPQAQNTPDNFISIWSRTNIVSS